MRILHVVATLDPAIGGVPEASGLLNKALGPVTKYSRILTLDAPDAPWLTKVTELAEAIGPSRRKFSYNSRLIPWLKKNHAMYDIIIAHGIWQYNTLGVAYAARKMGLPYFVYVHGQLDPWFKRAFPLKHLKKWLYWRWAAHYALHGARAVLFTTDEERLVARQSFRPYRVNEAVTGIGIRAPEGDAEAERAAFFSEYPELSGKRILLFMSRIHKVKGLDLLIEAFAQVAKSDPLLHLVIAGPDQEGLQAGLAALAHERNVAPRVTWTGMLTGNVRWGAYRAAEVFCLPSHSENFGIVVAEALARGRPVLLSNRVSIWREIDADGAGFVAPDTLAGTVSLLERWLDIDEGERQRMVERARSCFANRFEIHRAAETLVSVIENHIRPSQTSS